MVHRKKVILVDLTETRLLNLLLRKLNELLKVIMDPSMSGHEHFITEFKKKYPILFFVFYLNIFYFSSNYSRLFREYSIGPVLYVWPCSSKTSGLKSLSKCICLRLTTKFSHFTWWILCFYAAVRGGPATRNQLRSRTIEKWSWETGLFN